MAILWNVAGVSDIISFIHVFLPTGGASGKAEDHNDERMDCRGLCDGGWVEDTCEFCEPPSDTEFPGGSKYMDCSSTCVTPGRNYYSLYITFYEFGDVKVLSDVKCHSQYTVVPGTLCYHILHIGLQLLELVQTFSTKIKIIYLPHAMIKIQVFPEPLRMTAMSALVAILAVKRIMARMCATNVKMIRMLVRSLVMGVMENQTGIVHTYSSEIKTGGSIFGDNHHSSDNL